MLRVPGLTPAASVCPHGPQYLHSTGQHQFGRPIQGQREISAYRKSNALNQWVAMEGLYIKTATPKE